MHATTLVAPERPTQTVAAPCEVPSDTVPAEIAAGTTAWHPYLMAAFPTLAIWAANYHETAVNDLGWPLAASLGLSAGAVFLFRWFYAHPQRAALAATLLLFFVFGYGLVYHLNGWLAALGAPILLRDRILLPVWNISLILGLFALRRFDFDDERPTQALNTFSLVLVVLVGGSLVATAAGSPPRTWPAVGIPAERNEELISLTVPAQPRDVYCLVFDRYADAETLQREFAFDNRPFLDGLKKRGFIVPAQPRSNYPKTEVAMSAVLNMMYHGEEIGPTTHYRDLLEKQLVAQLFRQLGYQYAHFGCPLDGLRSSPFANANYRFSKMPSEFAELVYKLTPIYPYLPTVDIRRQETDKFTALNRIAELPAGGAPKFVYAHFLVPHEPWKFNRDGSLLPPSEAARRTERENYATQVAFVNAEIEKFVDRLLARPEPKPIILLLADEGPDLRFEGDQAKSAEERVRYRSGILSAYYLPGKNGGEERVPSTMTPVNAFRLVFREYFGANLPPLPDRVYWWDHANALGKPDFTQAGRFVDATTAAWAAQPESQPQQPAAPPGPP